jgi:nickel transport protein
MKPISYVLWSSLSGAGLAAIVGVCAPVAVLAHGAHIQSRTATAVEIQAAYDSGDPMAEAQVQVYAPDDPQTPVVTGLTDTAGRFVFVPDQPGNWEISVRQAGHGDIAVIPVTSDGGLAEGFTNDGGLTLLQRVVVAGAVTWGCLGTALFFWRGKR